MSTLFSYPRYAGYREAALHAIVRKTMVVPFLGW